MKSNIKSGPFVILLLMLCFKNVVLAQSVIQADSMQIKNTPPIQINLLKSVLDAHPDSLKAHNAYIKAIGLNNPILESQYKLWIQQNPNDVLIPLVIGTA